MLRYVWCDIEAHEMDFKVVGLFGSCEVEEVVSHERLRWYRHVECNDKSDWVSGMQELTGRGGKK